VRRLAFVGVLVAAACGADPRPDPGPADRFYLPTGIGVHEGRLLVASSNADLRYDDGTGGSVISVDSAEDPARLAGTVHIGSFAGELAVADARECPVHDPDSGSMALVAARGADVLYRVRIAEGGALSCDGCEVPLASGRARDAFAVGVACGGGIARAYVGYLRSPAGRAWITQVDLAQPDLAAEGAVQHAEHGPGQARGFAFDAARKRLFVVEALTGAAPVLRWIDLLGGCRIDRPLAEGGCAAGSTAVGQIPAGLELRSIALSTSSAPSRRAYVTARIYDPALAAQAGGRVGDFDGLLLVADLVDDVAGGVEFRLVRQIPIGYGASGVRVLPGREERPDVVAVLAADEGVLWIYDDETGGLGAVGRDAAGRPRVGRVPFGLAVDRVLHPDPAGTGGVAHVYVGSFQESFVTRIDVPLADPTGGWTIPQSGGADRRIMGGSP
jgi:hypothetical protein